MIIRSLFVKDLSKLMNYQYYESMKLVTKEIPNILYESKNLQISSVNIPTETAHRVTLTLKNNAIMLYNCTFASRSTERLQIRMYVRNRLPNPSMYNLISTIYFIIRSVNIS